MPDTAVATEPTQTQVAATAPAKATVKPKAEKTGNLILDTAGTVEQLTKVKALNRADSLVEDIEKNSFELGGVLAVIKDNGWFEPYTSFGDFVFERYGFQERKAFYLIEIYKALVTKNIPWEKVKDLGWTKLKDLAHVLTPENVDDWVKKASPPATVKDVQAMLKAGQGTSSTGESTSTNSEFSTVKFKLKNDQIETVQSALSKAKAEGHTDYDSVALEMICAGYLGGTVTAAKGGGDLKDQMANAGWKETLAIFEQLFPNVTLEATVEQQAAAPAA